MENDAWNPLQRRRRAVSAVVSDSDLMSLILRDTIGPSAFATASMVCKVWLSVCRSDEAVLRGVALYQGGLTKSLFTKLFAVAPREADALPHTTCKRFGGGSYFLYRRDAVDAVLAAGGINEWRVRLRLHAETRARSRCQLSPVAYAWLCKRKSACTDKHLSAEGVGRSEPNSSRLRHRHSSPRRRSVSRLLR